MVIHEHNISGVPWSNQLSKFIKTHL